MQRRTALIAAATAAAGVGLVAGATVASPGLPDPAADCDANRYVCEVLADHEQRLGKLEQQPEPTPTSIPDPTLTATAEPTPTAEPSPDPTPTIAPTVPAGWPGPDNTGAEPCDELKPSGSVTISKAGTTLTDTCVTGRIVVKAGATDVKIDNVWVNVQGAAYGVHIERGAFATMINLTLDGNTSLNDGWSKIGVFFKGGGVLSAADVFDTNDGIRIEASDVLIEHSWVHHLHRVPGGHHDAVQIRDAPRRVLLVGNKLEAYNPDSDDLMNAAIQMGSELSPERNTDPNLQIKGFILASNYLDGGTFTFRAGGSKGWVQEAIGCANVFGPNRKYGAIDGMGPGWKWDDVEACLAAGWPLE